MWYLKLALGFSSIVLSDPLFWGTEVVFLLLAVAALRFKPGNRLGPHVRLASLLWLVAIPLLVAALAVWQTDALVGHALGFHWQDSVLLVLLVAEVALAVWLVRRLSQMWLAVFAGVTALWYTTATEWVASMAMNHAWP